MKHKYITTGKQLFTIQEDGLMDDYEVQVAIDFNFPDVHEKIKNMSMYWSGHPEKSAPFEEHLDFFLRVLASDVFYLKTSNNLNDYGVAKLFCQKDGYYPLDGSQGILIKSSFFPGIDSDSFAVKWQKEYRGDFKITLPRF